MNKEEFISLCNANLNLKISDEKMNLLDKYYELLVSWNNKFNLTRIVEYNDVLLKHFYDSLCLYNVINLDSKICICDMGSGAGFPGIVLKIVFDKLDVTLIESNNKKCIFLDEVIKNLNLKNIKVECSRVEEYASDNFERFDVITTRAMANMRIISELALPMLKVGGKFIPLKSHVYEEMEESKNIINLLGATVESIYEYNLPIIDAIRTIPIIIKSSKGKKGFPRVYNKILKDVI